MSRVRAALPVDVARLAALEAEAFPHDAWPDGYLAEAVAGRLHGVVVHVVEDPDVAEAPDVIEDPDVTEGGGAGIVGYAITAVIYEIAELQRIAVTPRHRRRGLAGALLDAVLADARGKEAERLLLEVRETNAGALAFYERTGFVEIDRRPRYYRDGTTAIILQLSL